MAILSGFQTPRPTSATRGTPSTTRSSAGSCSTRTTSAAAARRLPVPAAAKQEVAKCLAYGGGLDPSAAALISALPPEGFDAPVDDLAPLLELPDPDDSSSSSSTTTTTTAISVAAQDDVVVDVPAPAKPSQRASADGNVIDVEAPAKPSQHISSVCATARSSSSAPKLPLRTAMPSDISSHATVVPDGGAVLAMTPAEACLSEIGVILGELQGVEGLTTRSKDLLTALLEVAAADLNSTATSLRLSRAAFWGKARVWVLATMVVAVATIDVVLAAALFLGRDDDAIVPPT